jgi:hypothetical protein
MLHVVVDGLVSKRGLLDHGAVRLNAASGTTTASAEFSTWLMISSDSSGVATAAVRTAARLRVSSSLIVNELLDCGGERCCRGSLKVVIETKATS